MHRRPSPFLVLGLILAVAACTNLSGLSGNNGTPVGVVLMNARTKGTGYTTSPKVNFYAVGSATFSFANINSDTCSVGPYDSTATQATTVARLTAGAFMIAAVSGDTDSLYKATTPDLTYQSRHTSGMPFTPGDSVFLNIAGDVAGFPQMQGMSRTAEPFTIARPVIPPVGQSMTIQWTPATDVNAGMYVALLYNAGGGTALNTQIFCDFHDDGSGTVQAYLLPALASSSVPFVVHAQRLRTALLLSPTSVAGYLNVISTFDVPTPVSP